MMTNPEEEREFSRLFSEKLEETTQRTPPSLKARLYSALVHAGSDYAANFWCFISGARVGWVACLGGSSVALTPSGRKAFFRAYELRTDTLVTHPLFGYRVTYRRLLEIQARLLAKVLKGELEEYPVFITR